jgi:hypothetical protein
VVVQRHWLDLEPKPFSAPLRQWTQRRKSLQITLTLLIESNKVFQPDPSRTRSSQRSPLNIEPQGVKSINQRQ